MTRLYTILILGVAALLYFVSPYVQKKCEEKGGQYFTVGLNMGCIKAKSK